MSLKLFRRHDSKCERHYEKEQRLYEHDSAKLTGKAQCVCTIYAEGKLADGRYLRPKSTGAHTFDEARLEVEKWGGTADPLRPQAHPGYQLRSVAEAIEDFLGTCRDRGLTDGRMGQLVQLLNLRLAPFTAGKRIEYIQEMDRAEIWGQFRRSWKNENPNRNRPSAKQEKANVPLGKGTVSRMIADLRMFLKHCISREWLSENWASRDHGMSGDSRIEPKEPFSPQDLLYIYRAAEHITDGRGFKVKRTGTENGFEDLVFAWTLDYSGLRISDVVALSVDNLVRFEEAGYTHAIWCNPGKTERKDANFVHIPIPNGAMPQYPNLVAALESLPLKHGRYFFLGGGPLPLLGTREFKERIRSATTIWRKRLDRLFRLAARLLNEDGKSFSVKPHPHRFRHTFCARLLQLQVPLRIVAQYIGDTEETVRKHYAKFCVAEQRQAARVLYEAMARVERPALPPTNFCLPSPASPTPG